MKITEFTAYIKTLKRLHNNQLKDIETAIKDIINNINAGQLKKGVLSGVRVYKFSCVNQQYLLAYQYENEELFLLSVGSHENFYRDLENSLKN